VAQAASAPHTGRVPTENGKCQAIRQLTFNAHHRQPHQGGQESDLLGTGERESVADKPARVLLDAAHPALDGVLVLGQALHIKAHAPQLQLCCCFPPAPISIMRQPSRKGGQEGSFTCEDGDEWHLLVSEDDVKLLLLLQPRLQVGGQAETGQQVCTTKKKRGREAMAFGDGEGRRTLEEALDVG